MTLAIMQAVVSCRPHKIFLNQNQDPHHFYFLISEKYFFFPNSEGGLEETSLNLKRQTELQGWMDWQAICSLHPSLHSLFCTTLCLHKADLCSLLQHPLWQI